MDLRTRLQFEEAFGPLNRWYCSQAYGQQVDDQELLLIYYIKSGGACDFAKRYDQATGTLNRWYCSEFYRRHIHDPEILWEYYIKYAPAGAVGKELRNVSNEVQGELSIAG